jgi:hypothetical protein
LRNIIAHGQEIPKQPYREKHDLISTGRQRINHDDYYYAELMLESGLFMLTTALRKVFAEGFFDDVADPEKWRLKMKIYEHRYYFTSTAIIRRLVDPTRRSRAEDDGGGNGLNRRDNPLHVWLGD